MKYIMLAKNMGETVHNVPVIFPDTLVHSLMAALVMHHEGMRDYKPVSAGFISLALNYAGKSFPMSCHGESETLKLKSRGDIDRDIIAMYDYGSAFTS